MLLLFLRRRRQNGNSWIHRVGDHGKAADLKTIGRTCNVIFTMLPNGEIVKEVLFREEGLDLKGGRGR